MHPSQEYRYERKFLVDHLDLSQVRAILKLHPAMFSEVYSPRYVNNIYLDTVLLDSYLDNLAGASERLKVRVRWYGDFFGTVGNPTLEYKVKQGLVGTKAHYSLQPFVMDTRFTTSYFGNVIQATTDLPDRVKAHLITLRVVLLNRYYRFYYANYDGNFRVTIDTWLTFYNADRLRNYFVYRQVDHNTVVVELKYQPEYEDLADRIASVFPFRATRSSKYVQGIERVYI